MKTLSGRPASPRGCSSRSVLRPIESRGPGKPPWPHHAVAIFISGSLMSRSQVRFHAVDFQYEGQPEFLFQGLDLSLTPGWTGIVGANGTGKTTLLKLGLGLLSPSKGQVDAQPGGLYCAQETEIPPQGYEEFIASQDGESHRIQGLLGLAEDWTWRWSSLSHGERKRAQLGVALWRRPPILAADEPTNHLDRPARDLVRRALAEYRGIGLLVSHDRELLDQLCQACVFVEPPRAVLRPGNYSQASVQAALERTAAGRARESARRKAEALVRETVIRRDEASQAHRKRSKRGLDPKDHDTRGKINLARLTGKDGQAGRLLRQLQGRVDQARQRLDSLQVPKEYTTGIRLGGSISRRNSLVRLPQGHLALGPKRKLIYPELVVYPSDRIALTGPNGAGKSTLMRALLAKTSLPENEVLYIPQEIDSAQAQQILERVLGTSSRERGRLMTLMSRLGSRPERLLGTASPSPGEVRKLMLALGLLASPHWIVMDEPTNHMDLPSVECLEKALAEVPCALLLASHDEHFLKALSSRRWEIHGSESGGNRILVVL